ncbi:MAG: peptide-methionine (S)-S-oxide reductase MsrA [Alphaproteobacteria bacterium]|nr:peptide-methionine (S)-S-oxide reductase MsrA [Alphaproteobacteria bacterium]
MLRHLFRASLPALLLALGLGYFAIGPGIVSSQAESATAIPAPTLDPPDTASTATLVVAGGCFWGVQGVFQHVEGVTSAVSGYAGGQKATAEYEVVGRGTTGHAESVRITYDPAKVSLGRLLQVYFSVAHDPTQLNRQGPDHGPQYRSTIFPQNDEQARVAKAYIDQLDAARAFPKKIATTLEPGKPFYPAEDYHQDYLTLHPTQPYIVFNDLPKVAELKRLFPALYRDQPVLVSKTGM